MNSYKMNLNRRKFLTNTTAAVGGIGMAFASVPFIGSWLPSAKAKALGAPVEVDISQIQEGQKNYCRLERSTNFYCEQNNRIFKCCKKRFK
jgi:Rieske Fe-S protein